MERHIFSNDVIVHKSKEQLKYLYRNLFYICLLLILSCVFMILAIPSKADGENIQESIASQLIRFHVIANSDSEKDQALKLEIKQALTDALALKLENVKDIDEARAILQDSLPELVSISDNIIRENGFTYTTRASLERGYFPLKVYGDLTLPPGEYEAVRVELGDAKGQNWWCVMYPPLCFVDATYSVVPESSKKQLKYVLTEEEYNTLFPKKTAKVKVKFKLLRFLNKGK